jgi:hypothetical protein
VRYTYRGTIREVEPDPPPRTTVFDPALCGTPRGYKQHHTHGTPACRPCKDKHAERLRKYRATSRTPKPARFDPSACGTYKGYARHVYHDQEPCEPCRTARGEYMSNYKAQRKEAA